MKLAKAACILSLSLTSSLANADIINFDFTGRFTIGDPGFGFVSNMPIAASLSYNTDSGIGSSAISITTDTLFFGFPMTFHDITMDHIEGTNLIDGTVLVDWNFNNDMPVHVQWDASGLFNAIDYGLQVGDTISGTYLKRNGFADVDIGSALAFSDTLSGQPDNVGHAPFATTADSMGFDSFSPFPGFRGYFEIGSGNSLHVTSISTIPVPAAIWLFGSGLLALVGFSRREI